MKKLLAICSILFTVCATFTGCGSSDESYMSNRREPSSETTKNESAGDRVDDVIDGIGDAGKDIIEGATNAAGDVIDGIEGKNDHENDDNNDRNNTTTADHDLDGRDTTDKTTTHR